MAVTAMAIKYRGTRRISGLATRKGQVIRRPLTFSQEWEHHKRTKAARVDRGSSIRSHTDSEQDLYYTIELLDLAF